MAIQLSTSLRVARGQQLETVIGVSPTLYFFTGSAPANCAAADSGTLIATLAVPSDWLTDNGNGTFSFNSLPWLSNACVAAGTIGYFRLKQGATVHMQGSCGVSGADMNITSVVMNIGDKVNVPVGTGLWTEGNA